MSTLRFTIQKYLRSGGFQRLFFLIGVFLIAVGLPAGESVYQPPETIMDNQPQTKQKIERQKIRVVLLELLEHRYVMPPESHSAAL
jgi:hypothetical protein